ncbi:MAG: M48 family metallopeptidase [Bacteroidota bacterium]
MKLNMIRFLGVVLIVAFFFTGCSRNPITGRNQLSLVSEGDVRTLALTQYKQVLDSAKVVKTGKNEEMVKRVGFKIAAAIGEYYKQIGQADALDGYAWEFNLIESKEINAWCMPGGKVVVYTGLLPLTQNETALAIVLGHEITHAVAGHGRERMSQQMMAQQIGAIGDIALGNNPTAVNIFNQVYSPTASVGVLLPNSRKQEYEADHYGLIFAAIAGYNPQEAIPFWQRMSSMGGNKPPVILSDHPADADRIAKLQELMPEALKYYKVRK